MKKISRTIQSSAVKGAIVVARNGEVVTKELELIYFEDEKMDETKAVKALQKVHGKSNQYIILSIDVTETIYEVSVKDFIDLATGKIASLNAK